ncbi:MAG: cytochrome c peroxidase [Bacteroidota bacterium]
MRKASAIYQQIIASFLKRGLQRFSTWVGLMLLMVFSACEKPPPPPPKPLVRFSALPLTPKAPADNPTTATKIDLGRLLFFDPILSGDKDVACATCHHPSNGYAEFRDISIGVNGSGLGVERHFNQPNDIPFVKRNAHTILNTAYNGMDARGRYHPERGPMFWDNRVVSLEDQALEPIKAHEEMRGNHFSEAEMLPEVIQRLRLIPEYSNSFAEAFGVKDTEDTISIKRLSQAIAAFERSLVTPDTRFDRFLRGDTDALSLSEQDGFTTFKKVGCGNCHTGPMLSDFQRHVLGVPENDKLTVVDAGPEGDFAFRTPSLRNLRYTAPYMHNGAFASLRSVLEFYEDIALRRQRNPAVPVTAHDPLASELTIRMRDIGPILSFLNALNADEFDKTIPESVPSGLPVGGNIE